MPDILDSIKKSFDALKEKNSKKKEKIKLKNALIVQQEQTINQINENCEKYIRQINNCLSKFLFPWLIFFIGNKDIDNQQIRIKELENQVTEYKEKLIESQKIIESNNSSYFSAMTFFK